MKKLSNIVCAASALFALAGFGLWPTAQAVVPAPDRGYLGQNTDEGESALFFARGWHLQYNQ